MYILKHKSGTKKVFFEQLSYSETCSTPPTWVSSSWIENSFSNISKKKKTCRKKSEDSPPSGRPPPQAWEQAPSQCKDFLVLWIRTRPRSPHQLQAKVGAKRSPSALPYRQNILREERTSFTPGKKLGCLVRVQPRQLFLGSGWLSNPDWENLQLIQNICNKKWHIWTFTFLYVLWPVHPNCLVQSL